MKHGIKMVMEKEDRPSAYKFDYAVTRLTDEPLAMMRKVYMDKKEDLAKKITKLRQA